MKKNMHILKRVVVGLCFLISSSAAAENVASDKFDQAEQFFIAGKYDQARDLAESLGTSDAYLLASEAITAKIILGYYDKPNDASKRARELAKKAVALDPENLDAQFHQVLSLIHI